MTRKNKTPRQSSNPHKGAGSRTPRVREQTSGRNTPRTRSTQAIEDTYIRFCFARLDEDGPWALKNISPDDIGEVLSKLGEFEKLKWSEVSSSKYYAVYDMAKCPTKVATERLANHYQGNDNVSRFRFTGKQRLFGFREGADFYIIWWDPEHEVWPSEKKHT